MSVCGSPGRLAGYPLLPCTPRSDKNAPNGRYPGGGQGFVELQFYPPGFAPFDDAISCDNTGASAPSRPADADEHARRTGQLGG
jgi:hypothetical protein